MTVLDVSGPHYETNEDGKAMMHPGYAETRCTECGAKIFTVINSREYSELCARTHCVKTK